MKKLTVAVAMLAIANSSFAADAPPSPHQFSGTATVVSDYIFRGLTQTWGGPAVQGSLDYAHASGAWASLWASNVSKKVVAGSNAEIDLALGYKGGAGDAWSYGAGLITIYYPGGNWNKMSWGPQPDQKYDFTEVNAFAGYRWVSVKYSRTIDDLLGFNEKTGFNGSTRGSTYTELNADVPLMETGLVLGLHLGRQDIKANAGNINADFTDYRVSLGKTFEGGWTGALQLTENRNKAFYNGTRSNRNENAARDMGRRRLAVSLTKAF